jgi:hypothetical protein
MQPRSSWGGETPRLLIDVAAVAHEHARPCLPGPLATETDQVLGQLRLGQVSAEGHASRSGEPEQNDLDRVPTQRREGPRSHLPTRRPESCGPRTLTRSHYRTAIASP